MPYSWGQSTLYSVVIGGLSMISLVSIVLNEEELIGDFIDYTKNIFDELVIVDGGSTDNTVDIIRSKGIEPFFNKWEHNFGAQRNFAIDKAKNNWCITLDPDERLISVAYNDVSFVLHNLIRMPYSSFRFYRANYIEGELKDDNDSQFRLFRKDRNIRYAGEIHEVLVSINGLHPDFFLVDKNVLYIKHDKTLKRAVPRWQYYKQQFYDKNK